MPPIVSVIVPVYNVEEYLDRCVTSILNQTLENMEIILVDDGSSDQSGQLCDKYSTLDSRVRIIHKQNGGLSSARNAGLIVATGKYIGFVDSDDDIEPNMFKRMVHVAEKYDVDFVMSDYLRIMQDNTKYVKTLNLEGGLYNKDKIRKDIYPNLIMGESIDYGPLLSVWHCLYRHNFLRQNNLYFDETIRWSEDNYFSSIVGYYCQKFYYLKGEVLYHYYQNHDSITTSYRSGAWDIYSLMNKHLHLFFDAVEDYDFSRQLKLHLIYYACNSIGQELTLPKNKAIRGIDRILNSNQLIDAFRGFRLPNVHFKLKIQLLLMKHRHTRLLWMLKVFV